MEPEGLLSSALPLPCGDRGLFLELSDADSLVFAFVVVVEVRPTSCFERGKDEDDIVMEEQEDEKGGGYFSVWTSN